MELKLIKLIIKYNLIMIFGLYLLFASSGSFIGLNFKYMLFYTWYVEARMLFVILSIVFTLAITAITIDYYNCEKRKKER